MFSIKSSDEVRVSHSLSPQSEYPETRPFSKSRFGDSRRSNNQTYGPTVYVHNSKSRISSEKDENTYLMQLFMVILESNRLQVEVQELSKSLESRNIQRNH